MNHEFISMNPKIYNRWLFRFQDGENKDDLKIVSKSGDKCRISVIRIGAGRKKKVYRCRKKANHPDDLFVYE